MTSHEVLEGANAEPSFDARSPYFVHVSVQGACTSNPVYPLQVCFAHVSQYDFGLQTPPELTGLPEHRIFAPLNPSLAHDDDTGEVLLELLTAHTLFFVTHD